MPPSTPDITLAEFLKRYTAISNRFIDEYMKYYDACRNNMFGILLDRVIVYLGIRTRKKFYTRFRKRYVLMKDYIIVRKKEKRVSGTRDAIYYVSFDTFEKLCMSSRTKKADEVRDYFVLLRKFVDYYKKFISDAIMKNIANKASKHMYIILVDKNKDIFKIGRTENIRNRLRSYATGKITHPDIKYILLVDDPLLIENCAKLFLKKYQYREGKELYKVDVDTIKSVLFSCAVTGRTVDDGNKPANATDNDVDAYIVYDDANVKETTIEYIDLDENVVGYEVIDHVSSNKKKTKSKSKSKSTSKTKSNTKRMSGGAEKNTLSENNMIDVYRHNKHIYINMIAT
jgi:phage anti-repressor protein